MDNKNNISVKIKSGLTKHKALNEILFILMCILLSLPAALIGYSGLFRSVDNLVEDKLYQQTHNEETDIVIIGITAEDTSIYGMYSNADTRLYELLVKLYEDSSYEPCVIGIDYPLQTANSVASAKQLGEFIGAKNSQDIDGENSIVVNNIFNLESVYTIGDDGYFDTDDDRKISNFGNPYYEINSKAVVGYSNLFYDNDGVLRHYSWQFTDYYGDTYNSFAKQVYETYATKKKNDASFVKTTVREVGDYTTYISYYGKPGHYKNYSYTEIITGNYNKEDLKDKIVLIGEYDSSLTQGYITSITRKELMYNVEIQANVIANVIDNRQIIEMPLALQLSLLMVFVAIAVYILLRLKFIWATVYLFIALFANLAFSNIAWAIGHPFHLLYLTVSYIICYTICLGIGFQKEKMSKSLVLDKFERVVDKNITNAILLEGEEGQTEPTNKNVCVMFADLRNFTAVSSSMESKDLVAMLNKYFVEASNCIKENEGTIDKFNGDAIMAIWNAPNDVDDCVYKACKAALEITQKIETLNNKIYEEFDRSLSFGIGLNYGEATVGKVGSAEHQEFTAIGDIVNVASRVESLAPRGCVFITKEVKEKLGNRARISSFDHRYSIKGKTDPIEVFLLEAVDLRPGYYDIQKINEVKNEF